jgi:hypothetical protein
LSLFWGHVHFVLQQSLCTHICPWFFFCWPIFVIMFVSLNSFVNKFDHEFYDELSLLGTWMIPILSDLWWVKLIVFSKKDELK